MHPDHDQKLRPDEPAPEPKPRPVLVPKDTQFANAQLLLERHGTVIRNVTGLGWHVWDQTHWAHDEDGAVSRLMVESIRSLYPLASEAPEQEQKRLLGWAKRSSSLLQVDAAITLAGREYEAVIRADLMDADHHLLNTAKGIIDLRDGSVHEHDPERLMTKLVPVTYQPDAQSDLWDGALHTWTDGDDELARFLQRAAGYTLTGSIEEAVLFFAHGPTASGKSTFLEALRGVMGNYARTADFDSFLARQHSSGSPRNDIARLAGARFVTVVEVDEGKKLAEALIKQVTGGDLLTARMLRKEHFEFLPRMKLWMAANKRPRVDAADGAMWRRILQIPFTNSLPAEAQVIELKRSLRAPKEQRAILAWAVRGAVQWFADGLEVPESVRAYTKEYRDEVDVFSEFFAEVVTLLPGASLWTSTKDLYEAYVRLCARNGDKPATKRRLGDRLMSLNLDKQRRGSGHGWLGVEVKEDWRADA